MHVETVCLLVGTILSCVLAVGLLSGIRKKISRISYLLWAVICGCSLLPFLALAAYLLIGRYEFCYIYVHTSKEFPLLYRLNEIFTGREGLLLFFSALLCLFGFVAVRYALRYDSKILGVYAAITGFVTLLSLTSNPFHVMEKPENGIGTLSGCKEPWMMIFPITVMVGFACTVLLCSLFPVARKRPVKVRRWIWMGFLFLGIGLLTETVWRFFDLCEGGIWSWDPISSIVISTWVLIAAFLHGKRTYSRIVCIMPFLCGVFGLLVIRSISAYLLVLFVLLSIVLSKLLMERKETLLPKIDYKNPIEMMRICSYIYVAVMLVVTMIQVIGELTNMAVFYDVITAFYVLAVVGLLLANQEQMPILTYVAILVWNTLLAILVLVIYPRFNSLMLVFFWICLFPVMFFAAQYKKLIKSEYALSHLFLSILVLSVILSKGVAGEYKDPYVVVFWIAGAALLGERIWQKIKFLRS